MNLTLSIARGAVSKGENFHRKIPAVLDAIADGTDTHHLVIALYLLRRQDFWHAHTYTHPVTPTVFEKTGNIWAFVRRFEPPPALPKRFQLIRMAFGMQDPFPRTITDIYGWRLQCERFEDLLAYTFGHELHHFRRYHLGLHLREGEQSACRWALDIAAAAGYRVTGVRLPRKKKKPRKPTRSPWPAHLREHFERLRDFPAGVELTITRDSARSPYPGQSAVKVRNLRKNSCRMAVRTPDGREWHWPMQWLTCEKPHQRTFWKL